jgi:hypothetical protein
MTTREEQQSDQSKGEYNIKYGGYITVYIMPLYECDICKIRTKQKANYLRHMNTIKHKQMVESTKSQPQNEFTCEYCEQKFSFKQSMYRHIKYRCTKNKDEDLKELVRLMNLQLQQCLVYQ